MHINCKICGALLAVEAASHITVQGNDHPTEHLDGIILKCSCGRTRTYYIRKTVRPQQPGDAENFST